MPRAPNDDWLDYEPEADRQKRLLLHWRLAEARELERSSHKQALVKDLLRQLKVHRQRVRIEAGRRALAGDDLGLPPYVSRCCFREGEVK
jgi:hypothetical protein